MNIVIYSPQYLGFDLLIKYFFLFCYINYYLHEK